MIKNKNKIALVCTLSLLAASLSPMGAFAAEDELTEEVVAFEAVQEEASETALAAETEVEEVNGDSLAETEADDVVVTAETVEEENDCSLTVKVSQDSASKNNVTTSENDIIAYTDMYLKMAAAANDKTNNLQPVCTKGSATDTGYVIQYYTKGKVKKLAVSDNGLKACDVTVNAKTKLALQGQYEVSGNSIVAENGFPLPVNPKNPNAKFKDGETTVAFKAIKGAYKYRVTLVDKTQGKSVTVHVENLAFHKTIKKVGLYSSEVSGNDISGNKVAKGRDTLVVRPTLLNIQNGADMLNGVWMVDKEVISQVGEKNAVTAKKNGSKCYIDEKSGNLIVTAPQRKGNAKIVYMINGKKFSTAAKAGAPDKGPKASLLPMRAEYAKYGLLYVTP